MAFAFLVRVHSPIFITLFLCSLVSAVARQESVNSVEVDEIGTKNTRNATINLYPASPFPIGAVNGQCADHLTVKTISLAPEVCLSGDYYLAGNLQITTDPICPHGQPAIMDFYHNRGCTGKPQYNTDYKGKDIPHECLWPTSPLYWSMIFRCGPWATLATGADSHETAIPPHALPGATNPIAFFEPSDGAVLPHFQPGCGGLEVLPKRPMKLPVDTCLSTPGYGIKITTPAVCPNGTRAQFALFDDSKCNRGEVTMRDGLVDIDDSTIGKCIWTGQNMENRKKKIGSVAFWCDGWPNVKEVEPNIPQEPEGNRITPGPGSVSDNACLSPLESFRGTTFKHPPVDTCVNIGGKYLKIYQPGICPNGTTSLLASYGQTNCQGVPRIGEMTSMYIKTCLDLGGAKSFAFWCTGDIPAAQIPNRVSQGRITVGQKTPNDGQNKGSLLGVVLILCFFGLFVLLALAIALWKIQRLANFVLNLFGRKEGAIAL